MSFAPILPWWVLLIAGLILVGACLWLALGKPLSTRTITGQRPLSRRERIGWWRRAAIALLLVGALLRPGMGGANVSSAAAQLDVIFVVDTTSSIVAEDYGNAQPRLTGVKADIMAISEKLPGANFSLITFDKDAAVRLPLTSDTNALANAVQIMSPEITIYSRGSSVTEAGDALVTRLQAAQASHPDRARVVYYLGDGEQTANSKPKPFEIPPGLIAGGAVLGYGTTQGGKMKQNSGLTGSLGPGYIQNNIEGGIAVSKIDESMLKAMAGQLGVGYVPRSAGDGIDAALAGVNSGTLTIDGQSSVRAQFELYWILALAVLALGAWELFDSLRNWRTLSPQGARARYGPKDKELSR